MSLGSEKATEFLPSMNAVHFLDSPTDGPALFLGGST
jgi:hypothetical protein